MATDSENQQTYTITQEGEKTIILTFTKILSEEESNHQAEEVVATIMAIFSKNPQKSFNLIIDLTKLESLPSFFTDRSRNVYTTLSKHPQLLRVAVVGANIFYKLVTNFLMTSTGKGLRIQWFDNKPDAISWLNKD
ncbi:MAG TPA: hypothetical protein VF303_03830 [Candidatus Nanoarchaeia archaeon]